VHGEYWERGSVQLKFQLGDIVFARVALSLVRRSARLDERPLDFCDAPEAPPQLDGADGYVVWSHPIAAKLPALRFRHDVILYTPQQYRRFFVDLSGGFEGYMNTFSGKTRSGLRRKLRKFAEASGGEIAWRQYRTPDQLATFFSLTRNVSAKTYQERLLGVGLPTDPTFIASACAMSKDDRIRAYLLFLNGLPISYLYCPVTERVVTYDRLGYDPAYASLSPGTVLQLLALEALFGEQQFIMFDFTEGEGQHKETFSTGSCLCGDVYVVRRRMMPVSIVVLHYAMNLAAVAAGATLDLLQLRSRLRRLIRGQWTSAKRGA
jgi:CelD/BcsL family acetyltransferase involved in cellulose biosynthesis